MALLALACAGASAAPIPARNGQIHACYKVKGKAKGAMRVVAGKHCRRGERRLAWSVTGPPGAMGVNGAAGGQGSQGAAGGQGNPGTAGAGGGGATVASLETKVASLNLEVETLKTLLGGLTSKTNSLCTEAAKVPGQIDAVGSSLNGLIGILNGSILGSIFGGEVVPSTPTFTCPG